MDSQTSLETNNCLSCGRDAPGQFCSACGQRQAIPRITVKSVVSRAITQFLSLDRGFGHTIVTLVKNPALALREYISGKTVAYAGPFRYFLVWMTIGQILAIWSGNIDEMATGFRAGWTNYNDNNPLAATEEISAFIGQYFVVLLGGVVPFLALWTRWLCFGSNRNFAENLVFHLYLIGHVFMFTSLAYIIQGIFGAYAGTGAQLIVVVVVIYTYSRAAIGFFDLPKWRSLVGVFVGMSLANSTYVIVGGAIGGLIAKLFFGT